MKCTHKMNVIAKISCYLERSDVTLQLRKEYLNTVTCNTSVLLWIKNWTVWYIECYCMLTYTGVTNCQKQSGFFGPPCISALGVQPHICHRFWDTLSQIFWRWPLTRQGHLRSYFMVPNLAQACSRCLSAILQNFNMIAQTVYEMCS